MLALMLWRGFRTRLWPKSPVFSTYIAFDLASSLGGFAVLSAKPAIYSSYYWSSQIIGDLLGFGVLWEFYRRALAGFAGIARFARLGYLVLLVLNLTRALLNIFNRSLWNAASLWSLARTTIDVERNLRLTQAVFLLGLLLALMYYRIRPGRNWGGLIWGYGFWVGTSLITLTVESQLPGFAVALGYLQQFVTMVALTIWVVSLWKPCPESPMESPIENGHPHAPDLRLEDSLVTLARVRAHLISGIKPHYD